MSSLHTFYANHIKVTNSGINWLGNTHLVLAGVIIAPALEENEHFSSFR